MGDSRLGTNTLICVVLACASVHAHVSMNRYELCRLLRYPGYPSLNPQGGKNLPEDNWGYSQDLLYVWAVFLVTCNYSNTELQPLFGGGYQGSFLLLVNFVRSKDVPVPLQVVSAETLDKSEIKKST